MFAALLILILIAVIYTGQSFLICSITAVLVCLLIGWPIMAIVLTAILGLLLIPELRSKLISKHIVALIEKYKFMPKISETEDIAIEAGTSWIEADLFSGRPDFKKIFATKYPKLSKEEAAYMENQVNEVCKMTDNWQVQNRRDLSNKTWNYLKKEKFFGMIIPKKYGGLGFSALGHSSVIQKLASRSQGLAITVMVPNSLGPAELLLHYGTDKQKKHYLPRLADGRDIPCFALTEPNAGSDATSIESNGVVFKDSKGKVRIKLNFQKRYITLGGVATVLGMAFQLKDPDNLLGKGTFPGITCALIDANTPGITRGHRHDALSVPFFNSPLWGKDVIIDVSNIIGEEKGIGEGWKMLMECLAVGRGISLPSTSAGGAKLVTRTVSNYTKIRRQFGISIGKFEAIQLHTARIAGYTYMLDAMRTFTAGAVDSGEKPAVANAIAKYHSTERFRELLNDGMDILGGAAICRGPRNLLSDAYYGVPIGITVEGANIMTRALIMFGQGAIRCHPYTYDEMKALMAGDVEKFDKAFFGHIGHLIRNKVRNSVLFVTRGYAHIPSESGIVGKYERKLAWASSRFAVYADLALAYYGGGLKIRENINGRFGDILSYMFMATAALRRFKEEGYKEEDKEVLAWVCDYCLNEVHSSFIDLNRNFAKGPVGWIVKTMAYTYRLNPLSAKPSDRQSANIAKSLMSESALRENLTKEIYIPDDNKDGLGKLEYAFKAAIGLDEVVKKIKIAIRQKKIRKDKVKNLINEAVKAKIITKAEGDSYNKGRSIIDDAVMVDSFAFEDFNNFYQKKITK